MSSILQRALNKLPKLSQKQLGLIIYDLSENKLHFAAEQNQSFKFIQDLDSDQAQQLVEWIMKFIFHSDLRNTAILSRNLLEKLEIQTKSKIYQVCEKTLQTACNLNMFAAFLQMLLQTQEFDIDWIIHPQKYTKQWQQVLTLVVHFHAFKTNYIKVHDQFVKQTLQQMNTQLSSLNKQIENQKLEQRHQQQQLNEKKEKFKLTQQTIKDLESEKCSLIQLLEKSEKRNEELLSQQKQFIEDLESYEQIKQDMLITKESQLKQVVGGIPNIIEEHPDDQGGANEIFKRRDDQQIEYMKLQKLNDEKKKILNSTTSLRNQMNDSLAELKIINEKMKFIYGQKQQKQLYKNQLIALKNELQKLKDSQMVIKGEIQVMNSQILSANNRDAQINEYNKQQLKEYQSQMSDYKEKNSILLSKIEKLKKDLMDFQNSYKEKCIQLKNIQKDFMQKQETIHKKVEDKKNENIYYNSLIEDGISQFPTLEIDDDPQYN